MWKVTFDDLGRNHLCFSAKSESEPDYDFLYAQAKGGLMSSDVDFAVMSEESGTVKGRVYAGLRSVGNFTIEKEAST